MRKTSVFEQLFRNSIVPENLDECWLWTARRNAKGYGQLCRSHDGKSRAFYAHRVMFEFFNGPIPSGLMVCHRCDNPPCVNPGHLWVGTNSDNIKDAVKKQRMHWQREGWVKPPYSVEARKKISDGKLGEKNHFAKLTAEKVLGIRAEWKSGNRDIRDMGDRYGTGCFNIYQVVSRRSWKHI